MTNQVETNVWSPVYQWEVTDPAAGGLGGVANTPLLQLTGRTGYLNTALAALAEVVGTLASTNNTDLTGIPTAPTPGAGNNSQAIATTEFVQTAISTEGLYGTIEPKVSAYQMVIGDDRVLIEAAAVPISLPLVGGITAGYLASIISTAIGTTILTNGATAILPSGAVDGVIVLPSISDFVTLVWDGTNWRLVSGSAAMLGSSSASIPAPRNLTIDVVSSADVAVTADQIVMGAANGSTVTTSLNTTINTAVTGVGGIDVGTVAASVWYAVWAVSSGGTSAGRAVLSLSGASPAPAILAAYPFYTRIGWVLADASSNINLTKQTGRIAQYTALGFPAIASGYTGLVSVGPFVPPTACAIMGFLICGFNTPGFVTSALGGNGVMASIYTAPCTLYFNVRLESSSISVSGTTVECSGWEDNL